MKRIIALIISLILSFSLFACKRQTLSVYVVDGAPVISVLNLFNGEKIGGKTFEIKIVSGTDALQSAIINKSCDVAVMPINLIHALHEKGAEYRLLSVSVFGCLYGVGKERLTSLDNLLGKTVVVVGQNGTPDKTFKKVLTMNNITYNTTAEKKGEVYIKYTANDGAILSLKKGECDYALLGEPMVTNAIKNVEGMVVAFDLKKLWEDCINGLKYTQAGVVCSNELLNDGDFVNALCSKLSKNKKYVYDNVESLQDLISENSALKSQNFTSEILDRINFDFIKAKINPNTIGTWIIATTKSNMEPIDVSSPPNKSTTIPGMTKTTK